MFATTTSARGQRLVGRDEPRVDGDAVHARVRARRLDRRLLDVDRDHRLEAEQRGGDREHAGAAADVEQRAGLELLQRLRGRAASSRASPVPNARPGSMTTTSASAGGVSHGGPTQRRPTRIGRWNARHLSSHPPSTSAARPPPKNAHMRSSPAASVYAASSTPPARSTSSKPSGKSSSMVARASSARSVPDLDRDAAERAQRNALFSFSKKLSSCAVGVLVARGLELLEQAALLVGQPGAGRRRSRARDGRRARSPAARACPSACSTRTSPGCTPAGSSSSTAPSSVSTVTVAPSAACTIVRSTCE